MTKTRVIQVSQKKYGLWPPKSRFWQPTGLKIYQDINIGRTAFDSDASLACHRCFAQAAIALDDMNIDETEKKTASFIEFLLVLSEDRKDMNEIETLSSRTAMAGVGIAPRFLKSNWTQELRQRPRELIGNVDGDMTAVAAILQMDPQKIKKIAVKYSMSQAKEQKIRHLDEERFVRLHSRAREKIDSQPLGGMRTQTRGHENIACAPLESATRNPGNGDKRCFTDDEGQA
jgi:hypothetical protein